MTRRRKAYDGRRLGLRDAVSHSITQLEHAVAYHTLLRNPEFSGMDVVEWLLPPADVATMKRAYQLLRAYNRSAFQGQFAFEAEGCEQPINCTLVINTSNLEIAGWAPEASVIQPQSPWHRRLVLLLSNLQTLATRWQEVRDVAHWLDVHATWGAVRYYWPTACALLPNDHQIHRLDGTTFREPRAPLGPMIQKFRTSAMTVAEAILCPLDIPSRPHVVDAIFGGTTFQIL